MEDYRSDKIQPSESRTYMGDFPTELYGVTNSTVVQEPYNIRINNDMSRKHYHTDFRKIGDERVVSRNPWLFKPIRSQEPQLYVKLNGCKWMRYILNYMKMFQDEEFFDGKTSVTICICTCPLSIPVKFIYFVEQFSMYVSQCYKIHNDNKIVNMNSFDLFFSHCLLEIFIQ